MFSAFLGIGSNLGDREYNIIKSFSLLKKEGVYILKKSSFYFTSPMFFSYQPSFINIVIKIATKIFPYHLLWVVKRIERLMGRRSFFRNAPRVIDIDILFYEDFIIENPILKIPHPGAENRPFFIVPMLEIEPGFIHPRIGASIKEIAKRRVLKGIFLWKKTV